MIRHTDNSHVYEAQDYDDNMCLKPPLFLWITLAYLCRGILLPLMIGLGHVAGVNADAMTMLRDYWRASDLIPSLVAAPVLFAMCRRSAGASELVQWLWKRGRVIIALSAIADALAPFIPRLWDRDGNDALVISLITSSIDVYLLVYVLYARRTRDTFLDFPVSLSDR